MRNKDALKHKYDTSFVVFFFLYNQNFTYLFQDKSVELERQESSVTKSSNKVDTEQWWWST